VTTPFGLRGFQDLSPWVTKASLAEFPDALRRELPPPHGVRDALARYEWRRIAGEALRWYQEVAAGEGSH
jgi:hypothetical protein